MGFTLYTIYNKSLLNVLYLIQNKKKPIKKTTSDYAKQGYATKPV